MSLVGTRPILPDELEQYELHHRARIAIKPGMESAVVLYDSEMSLQSIGDELGLNPIKVRKLLITAGVYESEVAEKVKNTFEEYRETQDYKTSILSTANILQLWEGW